MVSDFHGPVSEFFKSSSGCTRGSQDLDGVLRSDESRCGCFSAFGYVWVKPAINRRVGCSIGAVKKDTSNDAPPQSDRTKDCIVGFALGPRLILLAVLLRNKGY